MEYLTHPSTAAVLGKTRLPSASPGQHYRVDPVDKGKGERALRVVRAILADTNMSTVGTRERCPPPLPLLPPAGEATDPFTSCTLEKAGPTPLPAEQRANSVGGGVDEPAPEGVSVGELSPVLSVF